MTVLIIHTQSRLRVPGASKRQAFPSPGLFVRLPRHSTCHSFYLVFCTSIWNTFTEVCRMLFKSILHSTEHYNCNAEFTKTRKRYKTSETNVFKRFKSGSSRHVFQEDSWQAEASRSSARHAAAGRQFNSSSPAACETWCVEMTCVESWPGLVDVYSWRSEAD